MGSGVPGGRVSCKGLIHLPLFFSFFSLFFLFSSFFSLSLPLYLYPTLVCAFSFFPFSFLLYRFFSLAFLFFSHFLIFFGRSGGFFPSVSVSVSVSIGLVYSDVGVAQNYSSPLSSRLVLSCLVSSRLVLSCFVSFVIHHISHILSFWLLALPSYFFSYIYRLLSFSLFLSLFLSFFFLSSFLLLFYPFTILPVSEFQSKDICKREKRKKNIKL